MLPCAILVNHMPYRDVGLDVRHLCVGSAVIRISDSHVRYLRGALVPPYPVKCLKAALAAEAVLIHGGSMYVLMDLSIMPGALIDRT